MQNQNVMEGEDDENEKSCENPEEPEEESLKI